MKENEKVLSENKYIQEKKKKSTRTFIHCAYLQFSSPPVKAL